MKTIKIFSLFLTCIFLTNIHATTPPSSSNIVEQNIFSIKQIITNETVSMSDKIIGENLIKIANILDRAGIINNQPLLEETLRKIKTSTVFSTYEKWPEILILLNNSKHLKGLSEVCKLENMNQQIGRFPKLRQLAENNCGNRFWLLFPVTEKDDIQKYIIQNGHTILSKSNLKRTASALKKYQKNKSFDVLSSSIEMYCMKNNVVPSYSIIALLKKSEQFAEYLASSPNYELSTHKSTIKQFNKMLRSLKNDLYKNGKSDQEITNSFKEIISFFQIHELYYKSEKALSNLILISKILASKKKYKLSDMTFQMIVDLDRSNKKINYDNIFNLVWNYIQQENYLQVNNAIIEFALDKNLASLGPRLLFWLGHTKAQLKDYQSAFTYFKAILDTSPLSYHAIMATKMIQDLNIPQSIQLQESIIERYASSELNDVIEKKQLTPLIINTIIRLKIWNQFKNNFFANVELNFMNELKENEILISKTNEKNNNLKSKSVLFLAMVQAQMGHYLQSFNTIYDQINKGNVRPNLELLQALFPVNYLAEIKKHSNKIDPNVVLSLIRQESAFNPSAHSSAGARGLMQIMPSTARSIKRHVSKKGLHDPDLNMKIGIHYLERLLKKYNSNLVYTLAAYNAGERNLNNWVNNVLDGPTLVHTIEQIPFVETRNYVQLIFRNIFFYKISNSEIQNVQDIKKILDVDLGLKNISTTASMPTASIQ